MGFLLGSISRIHSKMREKSKSRLRSSHWDEVRDEHIAKHSACAACGSVEQLQVHHVIPFHLRPDLELMPENLITLCMDEYNCHLTLGHGGSFSCYNPNVREDARKFSAADGGERKSILIESKKKRLKA